VSPEVGFNFLNRDDEASGFGAALVLVDEWGFYPQKAGNDARVKIARLMGRGPVGVEKIAAWVRFWKSKGYLCQVACEPGARVEGWNAPGREHEDYVDAELVDRHADWFLKVCDAAGDAADAILYTPFPGVPGRGVALATTKARECIKRTRKIAAHLYAPTARGLIEQLEPFLAVADELGAEVHANEVNFAAGLEVDVGAWARDALKPFLDYCSFRERVKSVEVFAWDWRNADSHLKTPLTFKGTAVETLLREWKAPGKPTENPQEANKEHPMPEFTVGPGVAAKMKEQGDKPLSSEQYVGDKMSFAFGDKGVYVYSKDANRTYFLPAR